MSVELRESAARDFRALETLYPLAFPDEPLLPLVQALLGDRPAPLSLMAAEDGGAVGHALFTPGRVEGDPRPVALLGPLAVAPARQRQGLGGRLVREGLARLEARGVARVFVLGDPAYYARFGFAPEEAAAPPFPIPPEWREAWRSVGLVEGEALRGRLELPAPWMQPALWTPAATAG